MTGLIALSSLYAKYEASARKQLAYFSLKSENKGKQIRLALFKGKIIKIIDFINLIHAKMFSS